MSRIIAAKLITCSTYDRSKIPKNRKKHYLTLIHSVTDFTKNANKKQTAALQVIRKATVFDILVL